MLFSLFQLLKVKRRLDIFTSPEDKLLKCLREKIMQMQIILAVALEKANLYSQNFFQFLWFSVTSSLQVSIHERHADANKRFDSAENYTKQCNSFYCSHLSFRKK